MMRGHLVAILAAAILVAGGAVPLLRRLAFRLAIVDAPAARKLHTNPMPLLGGVAIYAAVVLSLLLYPGRRELEQLGGILVGATWVSLWGLWDDRRPLHPALKLASQLVAALLLIAAGVQVAMRVPDWLNFLITILWLVGVTNAFNLLDNMDGLAGGVGAVAAACFVLMAAVNQQYLVSALAAALFGGCLGFLIHNFNPARIFMGDSGSLFLGFLLAALGIKLRFPANVSWVTWMVPVLVLGVAIFDTTLVVISRLRRGLNPFTTPGRDHLSHRLVALGWTRREAVLLLYLLGCALGWTAVLVSLAGPREAYVIGGAVAVLAVVALVYLERVHWACSAPATKEPPP